MPGASYPARIETIMNNYSIAKQLFKNKFNGRVNFITPTVRAYGIAGGYAYEIAEGEDFNGRDIYGVTVINALLGEHKTDMGGVFDSYEAAIEYANGLGE